jgi:hypothetical protein
MKNITALLVLTALTISQLSFAQCETWAGAANEDHLTNQHSVYRGFVKNKSFEDAYEPWKEVYEAAPAADGMRDFHYLDGIKIHKHFLASETDETKKSEHTAAILRLYDEAIKCYQNRSISMKNGTDEKYAAKVADLYSRKAYDMYYEFRSPYSETLEALQYALEVGGLESPYTIISPLANITVYQFQKELISKEDARLVHDEMLKVSDHNISGGHQYAQYYQQAKDAAVGEFKKIQYQIFDCDYFKTLWTPDYEDNKEDPTYAKDLFNKLRAIGCTDEDPMMMELKGKWEAYASEENARRKAEFEANNPGIQARKAYEAGDFNGAIEKYRTASNAETDNVQKAKYHFSIASILFRKLNKYADARREALTAANLRPEWGRPFVLIGDIYSKSARGCGDSFNQSLAIIAAHNKWSHSKTKELNPSVAEDVDKKLSRYRQYFPPQEDGFMRGYKAGQKISVGCWIGETVSLRFK